ncbi:DUF3696 domain-containing protein [Microbacterium sp. B2969]|uniref:DUF3696 domain-containing protein n=1 Tax=Microbacterium alkaliflavum TaxID=3248839 RepID=A0ABW7Q5R5_9MICO
MTLNGNLVRLGMPRDVIRSTANTVSITCAAVVETERAEEHWVVELSLRTTLDGLRVSECIVSKGDHVVLVASDSRVTERSHDEVDPDRSAGDTLLRVREINGVAAPSRTYVSFIGLTPVALHPRVDRSSVLSQLRRTFTPGALASDVEIAEQFTDLVFSGFYRQQGEKGRARINDTIRGIMGGGLLVEGNRPNVSKAELNFVLGAISEQGAETGWQAIPLRVGFAAIGRRLTPRFLSLSIPSLASSFQSVLTASEILGKVGEAIRYLGPLREEPQVVSKSGARSRLSPVGLRGELTAELLATKATSVRYADWDGNDRETSLTSAVGLWSAYLGIGDDVTVEDQGKLGRGIRVSVNGVRRDLTTIGVGASQLLPVVAIVLDAPPQSIVLLEQPELHLHPSVQSRLADFLCFARPDIGIIVETHSEYIVTRLRRRVAEGRANPSQVHILFAEPREEGTEVRELRMSDLGNLDDWPSGFFDSQDKEARAIVRAIAGRRGNK